MSGPTNDPINNADLTSTLNKRADDFARLGGHDLDLARVVSRAGEIQRGRRMRASLVMAAVLVAIAVPVGITVVGNDGRPDTTPSPLVTSSATPTPTEAPTPNSGQIVLDGLTQGDAPATGYYANGTLHIAGAAIPVGKGGEVRSVTRISGGFLLARQAPDGSGDLTVGFLGDDGSAGPGKSWPLSGGVAVSADRTVGAFVEPNGTVVVVQDGGSRFFELGRLAAPGTPAWDVAAVTGENCAGRSEQTGCTVYVNDKSSQQGFYAITDHGKITSLQRTITSLTAARGDLLAGLTSVSDTGSCSAVTTVDNDTRWSTCDEQLRAFSPDGAHVLGVQAYGDGIGDSRLVVLDAADGRAFIDLTVADGVTLRTLSWEDDQHVLALVADGTRFAVIRFGLDGTRELALAAANGVDDLSPPFLISGS